MDNQFNYTEQELEQIFEFVKTYDSFNDSIKDLEMQIKELLNKQEELVIKLSDTRKTEEQFFTDVSERSGLHPSQLKKLAHAIVMEKIKPIG